MISVHNGPQGVFIAGEGIEQCLFETGKHLLLFESDVSLRQVKSAARYGDSTESLLESMMYETGKIVVVAPSQKTYLVGSQVCYDVATKYVGKNVVVHCSGRALDDFVDSVEHMQSLQFGFAVNNKSKVLFSPQVKAAIPPVLYCRHELKIFAEGIFSWFQTLLKFRPYELQVFAQNVCSLDVDDVLAAINHGGTRCVQNELLARLLVGTEYHALYHGLLDEITLKQDSREENAVLRKIVKRMNCLVKNMVALVGGRKNE